ncbi:LOW QUALITY PROTEIN: retinol dehydrogenase 5 [Polymixia lowei]
MVYVSSIMAFFNSLNTGACSVSKRGLEAFADCLRVGMARFAVKVSIVRPGFNKRDTVIDTMHDAILSPCPKYRHLLVSKFDMFFFYIFPYLPTFISSLGPMYHKRKAMLYSKQT